MDEIISIRPVSAVWEPYQDVGRVPFTLCWFWNIRQSRYQSNVIELRRRYSNMYIPSDFFRSTFTWQDAFPLPRPLGMGSSCAFHIMSKDVEPLEKNEAVLEPPDANYKYSAKVLPLLEAFTSGPNFMQLLKDST